MRFFSNDAKENTENDPDRTQDAQAVPQQRAGSPWSDAPAGSDSPQATDSRDGTHVDGHDHDSLTDPATDSRAPEHDDLDLPLDERDDKPYEQADVDESTVTDPDAPVNQPTAAEVQGSDEDPALRDEGGFDSPRAVDPESEKPLDDSDSDSSFGEPVQATAVDRDEDSTTYASAAADPTPSSDDHVASDDHATASADHVAVSDGPVLAEDPTPADTSDTAPVVAAVPVPAASAASPDTTTAAKPGSVEEKTVDTLFGADDAKAFQERWRDVQLRFVDSPKDATAEAAGLVDEAVDKLTASLKSQKDGLLSDSDDTEKLRVELRGYRDILNKVLAL